MRGVSEELLVCTAAWADQELLEGSHRVAIYVCVGHGEEFPSEVQVPEVRTQDVVSVER